MDVIVVDKIDNLMEQAKYNGGGISSLLNKGCVKSVQRGKFSTPGISAGGTYTIQISEVDASKSVLFITDAQTKIGIGETNFSWDLVNNGIVIQNNYYQELLFSCRWQVIEFY